MYSVLKSRLIADWSVDNMNHDMSPKGMVLDVSLSPKKKNVKSKRYKKHVIFQVR
jgi:hypothetical protein